MRTARLGAALLLSLFLGGLLPAAPVSAHASLVRSDPPDLCGPLARPQLKPSDPRCATGVVLAAAPATVRLSFSEQAEPFAGGIAVLSPSGRRVDRGPVRVAGTLISIALDASASGDASETGTYLVNWRVIATDTHPAKGSFAFSVRQASALPASAFSTNGTGSVSRNAVALQALARWLHLAGYALGFGPLALLLLVLRPSNVRGGQAARRLLHLANAGVLLMLLACVAALLAQTASLTSDGLFDPGTVSDVLASNFGRVLVEQAGAALLLWVLLGAVRQGTSAAGTVALALGAVLALADTEASHAASTWPLLGVPVTAVHLAVMGLWVGGLVGLLQLWRLPHLAAARTEILGRFGRLAAWSLLLLIATGMLMAVSRLKSTSDLIESSYGRTLLLKLCSVLLAALFAYAGRQRLRGIRERWWMLEAAILSGVLALAAVLVSLPPPR